MVSSEPKVSAAVTRPRTSLLKKASLKSLRRQSQESGVCVRRHRSENTLTLGSVAGRVNSSAASCCLFSATNLCELNTAQGFSESNGRNSRSRSSVAGDIFLSKAGADLTTISNTKHGNRYQFGTGDTGAGDAPVSRHVGTSTTSLKSQAAMLVLVALALLPQDAAALGNIGEYIP